MPVPIVQYACTRTMPVLLLQYTQTYTRPYCVVWLYPSKLLKVPVPPAASKVVQHCYYIYLTFILTWQRNALPHVCLKQMSSTCWNVYLLLAECEVIEYMKGETSGLHTSHTHVPVNTPYVHKFLHEQKRREVMHIYASVCTSLMAATSKSSYHWLE